MAIENNLPMTTAEALGSIPNFVETKLGETAFRHCLSRSYLDEVIACDQTGYVPELALTRFIDAAARYSGDEYIGLQLAIILGVQEYGLWGEYILSAPTLGDAILKAIGTIKVHASHDYLGFFKGKYNRFMYIYSGRNFEGYKNTAIAAVGPMLSLFKYFLGDHWRPIYIALDIPRPRSTKLFEEAFDCRLIFDYDCIEIGFRGDELNKKNPLSSRYNSISENELWQAYNGGPPRNFPELIAADIRHRLGVSVVSIDISAKELGISLRTLQRNLDRDGTSFRAIVQRERITKGRELLKDPALTVTDISGQLGYSSPGHFARAFRSKTGLSPSEFRSA